MVETPVLIAGGGPVGLVLALELEHRGVDAILAERNATTTRPEDGRDERAQHGALPPVRDRGRAALARRSSLDVVDVRDAHARRLYERGVVIDRVRGAAG